MVGQTPRMVAGIAASTAMVPITRPTCFLRFEGMIDGGEPGIVGLRRFMTDAFTVMWTGT